jgi:very-short-patch-repair endonuclease
MTKPRGTFTRIVSPHTRYLRANMTEAECELWHQVRDRRLSNAKFRKQVTIHPFVVDFLCIERRLVVEVDGCQHTPEADASRTAFLQSRGYRVIRFWNNEVLNNLPAVLEAIRIALTEPSTARGRGTALQSQAG